MRTINNDILLGETCRQLSSGKKVKLRAKGNSMRPFIHGNDILVITPNDSPRYGDVALARIDGKRYVIHRIIRVKEDKVILMGDSNIYETEECSRKDIFGTVESVIHEGNVWDISSSYMRLQASAWRLLLPFRRLKYKLLQKFCVPTTPAHPA